jgi:hypothetical protein
VTHESHPQLFLEDLARFQEKKWMSEGALTHGMRNIVASTGNKFVTLYVSKDPDTLGTESKRATVSSALKWEHLSKPVLLLAHQSGHFMHFFVDHSKRAIIICDSLSKTSSQGTHDFLIQHQGLAGREPRQEARG